MAKRLSILILPLVYVALNLLQANLYDQKVSYSSSISGNQIINLSPSVWKIKSVQFPKQNPYAEAPVIASNTTILTSRATDRQLTQNVKYYGFPFGFYFKQDKLPSTGSLLNPTSLSAYSIMWIVIDALLFLLLLAGSICFVLKAIKKSVNATGPNV